MDATAVGLIASEFQRIAPAEGEIIGAAVLGLDAWEVLSALRTIPNGAGKAAIETAIEDLVRRRYPDSLA